MIGPAAADGRRADVRSRHRARAASSERPRSIGLIGIRGRRVRSVLTASASPSASPPWSRCSRSPSRAAPTSSHRSTGLGTNLLTVTPGQTLRGETATLPLDAPVMIGRIGPVSPSPRGRRRRDRASHRPDPGGRDRGHHRPRHRPRMLDTLHGSVAAGASSTRRPALPGRRAGSRGRGAAGDHRCRRRLARRRWFTVVGILPARPRPALDAAALIGYPVPLPSRQRRQREHLYVRTDREAVTGPRRAGRDRQPGERHRRLGIPTLGRAGGAGRGGPAFTELFLGLGAVALLVGGVGIANVMLMSVLERRSEIGLRRALGATRRHIALQFVAEALALALLGGVLGVVVGVVVTVATRRSRAGSWSSRSRRPRSGSCPRLSWVPWRVSTLAPGSPDQPHGGPAGDLTWCSWRSRRSLVALQAEHVAVGAVDSVLPGAREQTVRDGQLEVLALAGPAAVHALNRTASRSWRAASRRCRGAPGRGAGRTDPARGRATTCGRPGRSVLELEQHERRVLGHFVWGGVRARAARGRDG